MTRVQKLANRQQKVDAIGCGIFVIVAVSFMIWFLINVSVKI